MNNYAKMEALEKKARKHHIHFLKFTDPKNANFDHPICYNGRLLEILEVTRERWLKIKNHIPHSEEMV